MTDHLLVLTTMPDVATARPLAQGLLAEALAACINIVPGMTSLYVWEGQTCEAGECLLLIKTRRERYPQLEAWLRNRHPYQVPEIIAIPIAGGLADYLGWIDKSAQQCEDC